MAEDGAVGILDRDVLGEGEIDGAVRDGEGGKLDSVNGDFWIFGFEDGEENYEYDYDNEDEEDRCYYT